MLYRKLEMVCEGAEERLNRVLEVRNDVDLLTLGYILLLSVQSNIDFGYTIETNNICYVFDSVMDDESVFFETNKELRALSENHLCDLPGEFTLKYFDENFTCTDYEGDYWQFNIRVDASRIKLNDDMFAHMLDGKGMGIWENQKQAYFEYLKGNIDPNASEDINTDDLYVIVPENLDIETYGECEYGFDFEDAKEYLEDEMYPGILEDEVEETVEFIERRNHGDWDTYFDDDDEDDLDDFLDNVDDMDERKIERHLLAMSMFTAISCIQNIDFVSEKFEELSEEYDSMQASLIISQVIAEMLEKFMSGELLENNAEFKKKIEELK